MRDRSIGAAALTAAPDHAWLPVTSCTADCLRRGRSGRPVAEFVRVARRITATALVLSTLPMLLLPLPGRLAIQRRYCRAVLSCLGIRFTLSGDPIRNLRGMLVVSNHVSWVDVFAIGAVLPGSFVARADLTGWPVVGLAARLASVIPIDRRNLRQLPAVIEAVSRRLRDGRTVVVFPEGTTYCGPDHGRFRPALFQAAIDSGRPVVPVRLTYRDRDGHRSTAPAFFGDHSLWDSVLRIAREPRTTVEVHVRPLRLPTTDRGRLAAALSEAAESPRSVKSA